MPGSPAGRGVSRFIWKGLVAVVTEPVLYLVVPCYNEEEVLPETSRRLLDKIQTMTDIPQKPDHVRQRRLQG